MRNFDDSNGREFELAENRLESPAMVGFRSGMTSTGVIGRKLSKIYTPSDDAPKAIGDLAGAIDREIGRLR